MKALVYQFIHVSSVFLLAAVTFFAIAAPRPERRKKVAIISGVLSLVALVGGFGLLAVFHLPFRGWVVVKLICWFLLSGLAGMAFRTPQKRLPALGAAAGVLIVTAVFMVVFKPF